MDNLNISLDQMRYFLRTAQVEHVSQAAQTLRVSPSSVSQAIAHMESQLKTKLFTREKQRIRLTPYGRHLAQEVQSILTKVDCLRHGVHKAPLLAGKVRLVATHGLMDQRLAPAAAELLREYPDLDFSFKSTTSSGALMDVLAGHADLAICYSPQNHPDLLMEYFEEGRLVIALKQGHPLSRHPNLQLSDLSTVDAILPPSAKGIDTCERHPMFQTFNIEVHIKANFDNYDAAAYFVRKSNVWTLIPETIALRHKLWTPKLPTKWKAPYHLAIISRRDQNHERLISAMMSLLQKHSQSNHRKQDIRDKKQQ